MDFFFKIHPQWLELSRSHKQTSQLDHITSLVEVNKAILSDQVHLLIKIRLIKQLATSWSFVASFFSMFMTNICDLNAKFLVFSITCWYGDTACVPMTTRPYNTMHNGDITTWEKKTVDLSISEITVSHDKPQLHLQSVTWSNAYHQVPITIHRLTGLCHRNKEFNLLSK